MARWGTAEGVCVSVLLRVHVCGRAGGWAGTAEGRHG